MMFTWRLHAKLTFLDFRAMTWRAGPGELGLGLDFQMETSERSAFGSTPL